jgi:pimeloyl-ACP methyl ester carboxylesterase
MLILKALLSALVLPVSALAQEHITFPTEDGGVVLAHGGRFTKERWQKHVEVLVHAGFRALAIDLRGRGGSHGPLAAWTDRAPEKIKGRKLFIGARDDANDDGPRLPRIRANYGKAVGPKELIILDGSAHAQFLFATNQGDRLMREILRFLSEP